METDNLILEHLRGMRASLDRAENQLDMLIVCVSSLEGHTVQLQKSVASIHEQLTCVNLRLEHLEGRLERIERRLDVTDAAQGINVCDSRMPLLAGFCAGFSQV